MTELSEAQIQTEKAYQKQYNAVFTKEMILKPTKAKRWYKNVGLGFKTPRAAVIGNYIDKKCPFTGAVNIRGRILKGVVRRTKMHRTIIIRRDYLHYVRKYNRYEKRHKNIAVHCSPCFRDVAVGDIATVGECRPLSKTVRFNVLKLTKPGGASKRSFHHFE